MDYPNNIKKTYKKEISHSNRGMDLENLINLTNEYYLNNNIAVIYKKPTPIGIAKVKYFNNKKMIDKAYFKEQSTLDYNGLYKGKYLDFDAKMTTSKTSFPLSNIHEHQLLHIRNILKHGGISFIILKINLEYYLLTGEDLINYIDNSNRKSIEYKYITNVGHIIKEGYIPALDYLKVIDKIYFKGESSNGTSEKN